MTSWRIGLVSAAIVALAAPIHAADRTASRVDDLRSAQERVARAANQTKGGHQHLLLQEEQRLSGLIDDLESGRSVSPEDIDRALQRAENPGL